MSSGFIAVNTVPKLMEYQIFIFSPSFSPEYQTSPATLSMSSNLSLTELSVLYTLQSISASVVPILVNGTATHQRLKAWSCPHCIFNSSYPIHGRFCWPRFCPCPEHHPFLPWLLQWPPNGGSLPLTPTNHSLHSSWSNLLEYIWDHVTSFF